MQAYDIIMLIVLLVAIIMGYRRGLAWQVASISAIFVSYFVAIRFRDVIASRIDAAEPWNTFLAMLILYIASSLVIWIAFQLVKGAIDRAKMKEFDQQMGAMLGAVKGIVLCIVITFFAVTLLGETQKDQIIHSRSGYFIARLLDKAHGVMPAELDQVLGPYLKRLDEQLEPGRSADPAEILEDFDFEFPSSARDWRPGGDSDELDEFRDDPRRAQRDNDRYDRVPTSTSDEFSVPYRR
jgi:membrane protein required for colicin V production